jgi:hypothetical protein
MARVIILLTAVVLATVSLGLGEPTATTPAPTSAPTSAATSQAGTFDAKAVAALLGETVQPLVQTVSGGQIDWTGGYIIAIGASRSAAKATPAQEESMAKQGARVVAARNAILMIAGIPIDARGRTPTVKEGQFTVEGVLKDFHEISNDYDAKGGVAVCRLQVPIYGVHGVIVRPEMVVYPESMKGFSDRPATAPDTQAIVIDARGTGFIPTACPEVADARGKVIVASSPREPMVSERWATAIYVTADPALKHSELTERGVLVLSAEKTPADATGRIVLSEEQTKILTGEPASKDLWRQGRVVIIADVPAPPKPQE